MGTTKNFLYFSFVTITTVGYGDLTAGTSLGRSIAIAEALTGQIYLVTVVAAIVGVLGGRRQA
ncbi:MAG TPA: potassium channel family protein [Solirubrobacterales bacterium]|nr:potassium channel family protein [Solirubrobacterales bacterium]